MVIDEMTALVESYTLVNEIKAFFDVQLNNNKIEDILP